MRQFLRALVLLLAWAALLHPGSAQAQVQTQFSCDGTFYQIRQVGTTSHLFVVDRSNAAYTTIEKGTGLGVLINALAYNSQDGFMYAVTYPTGTAVDGTTSILLYRIGFTAAQTPTIQAVGTTNLPKGLQLAAGTFDKAGNYYLSSQNTQGASDDAYLNTLYRIRPSDLPAIPTSTTPITAAAIALRNANDTGNADSYFFDMAYNPIDNKIYGVLVPGILFKIDVQGAGATATKALVTGYNSGQATLTNEFLGSAIFDVSGALYAYSNGDVNTAKSGKFYKINSGTDNTNLGFYTQLSNIDPAAISDGASCINPGNALDVVMSTPELGVPISPTTFDVTYTIKVKNTNTSADPNVQVNDFLTGTFGAFPGATSVTKQTLTVTNVTSSTGTTSTLAANTAFTGTGSNTNLLTSNQALAVGESATITLTVRVVYPNAASVPLTPQNNTVYATSTNNTNPGYLVVNGTLVPPDYLLANDLSTNSATLPGLVDTNTGAHGDAPSPTPVSFPPSISGTVFEDVNYGGGAGRPFDGTAGNVARSGATVELYTSAGAYVSYTTTDATGNYAFQNLSAGTYTVRVVNSTVTSSRNTGTTTVLGVQTFVNGDVNRVGGQAPAKADAAANTGTTGGTKQTLASLTTTLLTPESITSVSLGAAKADVDFGFNFDVVTNTSNAGQGSLRQFILNANALDNTNLDQAAASSGGPKPAAGVETSIFMIPDGNAHDGLTAYDASTNPGLISQLTGGVAQITPGTALPAIGGTYGANTSLDGTTQTQNVGNTNNVTLGTGGTVGTGPTALAQLNGPEVQLTGSTTIATGVDVASTGTNTTIKGLAIYGFGNGTDSDANGNIRSAANSVTIAQNVLGTTATSFALPATVTNADNIRLTGGTAGISVAGNLIGFANGKGIAIGGGVTNVSVTSNEVNGNGRGRANLDGLDIQGSAATVTGNLFTGTSGQGIDSYNSAGNNTITGNTISDNGRGTATLAPDETPGVRIYGAGNRVNQNIISNNYGAGVQLTSGTGTTIISQNAIFGNGSVAGRQTTNPAAAIGQVGIDLQSTADNAAAGTAPYVTLNDNGDGDTGANGLLNFPVLSSTTISRTTLVVTGYARPGSKIEFFLAQPNALTTGSTTGNDFGQGQSYLVTPTDLIEGGGNDTNAGTGSYSGPVNGINQGTDNTNLFTFSLPLSSLTSAQLTALQSGTARLTSTATLSTATSEFSGNLAVPVADVTVSLAGPTTLNTGLATGTYTATFTNEGPQAATNVARVLTLPAGATLTPAQQTTLTNAGATIGSSGGNVTLTYSTLATLANNANSVVTFAFTAPTTVSTTLSLTASTTANSQGANTAPDQAALTLSTVATADVTASISASASATAGTFTATFGNSGPQAAAGVVPTVQLPAGLTLTGTPSGWTYTSSTGLLTYAAGPTSFAASTPNALSVTITYPLNSAPSTPVTATARVSTTTDEAGSTANNVATATMAPQFDLTTTLTGPATTIIGSPTMLYVTTTNNGPNTAGTAAQTVTIPSAATLAGSIFITNGGTYSFSGTTGTVTFPALANLPSGQTVTNSISFLAPAANFAPSATVTTTSSTETNTTNNTAYLNGAAASTAITVGTVTTQANEATTITATTVVNGVAVPATVVSPGSVVTYTVTSTNKGFTGTTPSAPNVTEKVQLLPGLTAATLKVGGVTGSVNGSNLQFTTTAATGTGTVTTAGTSTYDPNTGILTYYNVATQASGVTELYPVIAVTAPATVGNGGQLVATASVSTDLKDNVPADNMASVGVRVTTTPDVATTITGPSTTVAGLPATYVVRFANNGATDAVSVTETAQLPAGLSNVVVRDANGSVISNAYSSTTGQITFAATTPLAPSATQLFTITLNAPGQNFPVSSTVASATADGVSANNSASLATTVTPNADLAVSISGPATAVVGNSITYVVTTTNNGPTVATNVVPTLQLPNGLTVQGSGPGGSATIATANGIDTYSFPATTTLAPGGSVISYISFTMPNPASGQITGAASVSSGVTDAVASNNTAALTTSIAPATTSVTDLVTSLSLTTPTGSPMAVAAGTALTYTAAYRNNGPSTATDILPTANLPTGLLVNDLKVGGVVGMLSGTTISFGSGPASGATYNIATGLLTFPTISSQVASTPATSNATNTTSYTIAFPAPVGSGQLVVLSEVTSPTTDNVLTNNRIGVSTTINTVYDVTNTLAGPVTAQAGATNTYTVTTLNGGPSMASTLTTQTVTLPAGATATNISGSGTQSGTTITWTIPVNQPAGLANAVVNSFSLVMPTTGNLPLTAAVSSAGENVNTLSNTATLTTTQLNIAPVAQNVWNSLQSARSNDANMAAPTGLPISPLAATDVDGTIGGYTIVTVPTAAQGYLYYNGGTTAVAANTPITDATKLTFAPTAGYVGNATFTYVATDNGNGVAANTLSSPAAIYTIPVAADQEAPAYVKTPLKGGLVSYNVNDVIAYTVDPNVANYGSTGTVYATDGKTLNTNANNGISSATAVANTFKSSRTDVKSLDDLGLIIDATGRIVVNTPGTVASPKLRTGSYSVDITTIDANGGVSTQTVTFVIPAAPLPVELTAFTAQAVQNRDALLSWTTASELNSASFDIERSLDGTRFTKIGQLAAKGNATGSSSYTFTDASVAARASGAVYYRLRQVDLDATATYSPVRTVSFSKVAAVALGLYPNPAQNATTLDVRALPATATYQVRVLDATGRAVLTLPVAGGQLQPLNLTGLATGTYHVLVTGTLADGSALRQVLRLTKE